jgi:ribosome-associated protein
MTLETTSARPLTSIRSAPNDRRSLQLALAAARTAEENHGRAIVILDLRQLTPIFDYFVIATGTSRRQLHAMAEDIDHVLEDELGDRRMSREGYDESRWILLDYGNVMIHLFDDETRGYYDLEGLWADAPRVPRPVRISPETANAEDAEAEAQSRRPR